MKLQGISQRRIRFSVLLILLALLLVVSLVVTHVINLSPSQPPTRHSNPGPTLPVSSGDLNLIQYVNPLIGTSQSPHTSFGAGFDVGDVIPAATYPLGMVQWGPDTTSHLPGNYYYPDNTIKGFSLTHFSGRGCSAWGDFPFMPYVGNPPTSSISSTFSHQNEIASPGYYEVLLNDSNVGVQLTATAHGGVGQFSFPHSTASSLLINAGGSVNGSSHALLSIDPLHREVTGQTTSKVGCGNNYYTLFFTAQFDSPFSSSTNNSHSTANLTFDTTTNQVVHVNVGISFVSIANARLNRTSEIGNLDFNGVRAAAEAAWNSRLNTIQVQGGTTADKDVFYTALYHTLFHPNIFNDVNRQYFGFDGKVHTLAPGQQAQYENIPGWDEYRSLTPLRAILAPTEASDLAQSLVNDALQSDGHLPRWEQASADSHGMNGDSADVEIADIYAYGNTSFNTTAALAAMINGQPKIREGLNDYISSGYVANNTIGNSVVITQEYANDDFALAQFARAQGNSAAYRTYLQRSANWKQVLNTASGYVQPRNRDGSWSANFSPASGHGFQETDSAQSTWLEPFNLRELFDRLGGNNTVVKRLDAFFKDLNAGPNSMYAYMGNEPDIETPWEYDFAGAPSHTQAVVRRIQTQLFTDSSEGLPGNDDGGTMSAWYVFSAIGLYPEIPGVAGFVIGSPLFPEVTVRLAGGHTLQIHAPAASDNTPYVQSLTLNGQASSSLWLPWSNVKDGATLDFALGAQPTKWGSNPADAPPSFPATP